MRIMEKRRRTKEREKALANTKENAIRNTYKTTFGFSKAEEKWCFFKDIHGLGFKYDVIYNKHNEKR